VSSSSFINSKKEIIFVTGLTKKRRRNSIFIYRLAAGVSGGWQNFCSFQSKQAIGCILQRKIRCLSGLMKRYRVLRVA